jgi:hypothetical protein
MWVPVNVEKKKPPLTSPATAKGGLNFVFSIRYSLHKGCELAE